MEPSFKLKMESSVPYLLALLRNTRVWNRRRISRVDFRNPDTVQIKATVDFDLSEVPDEECRQYLEKIESEKWSWFPIPLLLKQSRLASFHITDYRDRHLSLLNTTESEDLRELLIQHIGEVTLHPQANDAILVANRRVKEELEKHERLAILQVPSEYLQRHAVHYSYWGPLGIEHNFRNVAWRIRKRRGTKAGYPDLIRLRLLHAQSTASYHFEVDAPPGTVIYDRWLDRRPPMSVEGVIREGFAPSVRWKHGSRGLAEQWPSKDHATVFMLNSTESDVTKLEEVWLNIWIGVDRKNVGRPLIISLVLSVVMVMAFFMAYLADQEATQQASLYDVLVRALPPELPADQLRDTSERFQQIVSDLNLSSDHYQASQGFASAILALGSAFFGYSSVSGEHPVSNHLYRGVQLPILAAGIISLIGFVLTLLSIDPQLQKYILYPLGGIGVISIIPAFYLSIIWRRGTSKESLQMLKGISRRSAKDVASLALASRYVG